MHKSTSESGAATPSSRRRIDGVQVMICALRAAATDAARPPTTAALADSMRSANSSTSTLHFVLSSSSGVAWRRRALEQRRGAVCRLLTAQANAKANLRIFLLICAVCEATLFSLFRARRSFVQRSNFGSGSPIDGCHCCTALTHAAFRLQLAEANASTNDYDSAFISVLRALPKLTA